MRRGEGVAQHADEPRQVLPAEPRVQPERDVGAVLRGAAHLGVAVRAQPQLQVDERQQLGAAAAAAEGRGGEALQVAQLQLAQQRHARQQLLPATAAQRCRARVVA